mmetsp:Transcript_21958/g.30919  ORF Transcript_21958/g.30919 Transcript_21958/m.30919 type:complete len:115 (-) Transcript_21958:4-348(-)
MPQNPVQHLEDDAKRWDERVLHGKVYDLRGLNIPDAMNSEQARTVDVNNIPCQVVPYIFLVYFFLLLLNSTHTPVPFLGTSFILRTSYYFLSFAYQCCKSKVNVVKWPKERGCL